MSNQAWQDPRHLDDYNSQLHAHAQMISMVGSFFLHMCQLGKGFHLQVLAMNKLQRLQVTTGPRIDQNVTHYAANGYLVALQFE